MKITFSGDLDKASATNVKNYTVRTWDLKRTKNYGSKHYNEQTLKIESASLAEDGRTIVLTIPQIAPTWCMEIRYDIRGAQGEDVKNVIHNTIHNLRSPKGKPSVNSF